MRLTAHKQHLTLAHLAVAAAAKAPAGAPAGAASLLGAAFPPTDNSRDGIAAPAAGEAFRRAVVRGQALITGAAASFAPSRSPGCKIASVARFTHLCRYRGANVTASCPDAGESAAASWTTRVHSACQI